MRIGKRDFFGRLAPLANFARTVVATTILLAASGIESYEILANRMGRFLRLRPRKRLVAGDPLRLVYIRCELRGSAYNSDVSLFRMLDRCI